MTDLIDRPSTSPDADTIARDTKAIIEMCSLQLEHALCFMHLLALTDGETTHNPTHTTRRKRWGCAGKGENDG